MTSYSMEVVLSLTSVTAVQLLTPSVVKPSPVGQRVGDYPKIAGSVVFRK